MGYIHLLPCSEENQVYCVQRKPNLLRCDLLIVWTGLYFDPCHKKMGKFSCQKMVYTSLSFCKHFLFKTERFEPRSHFISRLSMIVRVNIVLNRTVVADGVQSFSGQLTI